MAMRKSEAPSAPLLFWGIGLGSLLLLSGCAQQYDMSKDLQGDFEGMVQNYRSEADRLDQQNGSSTYRAADLPAVPADFRPAGQDLIQKGLDEGAVPVGYELEDLYVRALQHSSQIRVFSDVPLIRETGKQEAEGDFDTHAYVETSYDKTDVPAGTTLTTGGPDYLRQTDASVEAGLTKKTITGTEVTASEKVDHVESNSLYFLPDPQNTATLTLKMVQPLLKGAGIAYNSATMRVADIDSQVAREEFIRQAESHLLEINRAYWSLYLARGLYFSRKQLVDETTDIVKELDARTDVDAVRRQQLRANAALAERKANLVRSEAAIHNAQDRLVALINDPQMEQQVNLEIIPKNEPTLTEMPANLRAAAAAALKERPEVAQGFFQLKAAAIREQMQRNELLPTLNLILAGTWSGLSGGDEDETAWGNQYEKDGPGYEGGIRVDMPLENNEAEARLERRKLELRQEFDQLQTTIETVLLEVKVSVRELQTAYRDLQAKYSTYQAAKEEVDDLQARKDYMLGPQEVAAPTYFEYVLDSQDRLLKANDDFLESLATYNVAITNLQKSQGTLLSYEKVEIHRSIDSHGLPVMNLEKTDTSASATEGTPASTSPAPDAAPAAKPAPAKTVDPKDMGLHSDDAAPPATASDSSAPSPAPDPTADSTPTPTPDPNSVPDAGATAQTMSDDARAQANVVPPLSTIADH